MRRGAITLVVAPLLGLSLALPALADYQDVRFDADDLDGDSASFPDIRSSTRRVFHDGGRYLSIQVRAYEDFGLFWFIRVRLDTRAGPKPDYSMTIDWADQEGRGCYVWPRHHRAESERGAFSINGDRVRCRIPFPPDPRGKRVRWKLVTVNASLEIDRSSDHAPDEGWYP